MDAYREVLREIGLGAGLDAVGFTTAEPFEEVRVELERRRAAGLAADMQFTYRNPERATTPERSLPDGASLIVGTRSYAAHDPEMPARTPHGRVARFARGDSYGEIGSALAEIAARLRADGHRARVLVDDNALVDRAAAHRAGLGWWGKNSHILRPDGGSWFVLGAVLTSCVIPSDGRPMDDQCGSCTRCITSCPTGAITDRGVVDARRCLTWLLQADGDFPHEYRAALGDRLYGCDDCQLVCPPSRLPDDAPRSPQSDAWKDVLELLSSSDEEILEQCGAWYIAHRDPDVVRRNALVVLGNHEGAISDEIRAAVARYVDHPQPRLAAHARWAEERLGLRSAPT